MQSTIIIILFYHCVFFLILSLLHRQSHRQERQSHPGDCGQVRRGPCQDWGRQRQKASPGGGRQAGGWQGRHCQQQRGEWTVRLVSQSLTQLPPPSPTPLLAKNQSYTTAAERRRPMCCLLWHCSFLLLCLSCFVTSIYVFVAFNTCNPLHHICQLC